MFGLITRRRHEAELAAAKAEADRLRTERDEARAERETYKSTTLRAAGLFAEADAANKRLTGRVDALKKQLQITDAAAGIDHERAEQVGDRLRTVREAAARGREQVASGGEAP